LLESTAVTT
jgi:hypothetical protein